MDAVWREYEVHLEREFPIQGGLEFPVTAGVSVDVGRDEIEAVEVEELRVGESGPLVEAPDAHLSDAEVAEVRRQVELMVMSEASEILREADELALERALGL